MGVCYIPDKHCQGCVQDRNFSGMKLRRACGPRTTFHLLNVYGVPKAGKGVNNKRILCL